MQFTARYRAWTYTQSSGGHEKRLGIYGLAFALSVLFIALGGLGVDMFKYAGWDMVLSFCAYTMLAGAVLFVLSFFSFVLEFFYIAFVLRSSRN